MIVYYSTIIFSQVGLSPFLSQLLAAVMNTCFALGTWLLPWTIERFGRRNILFRGAIACTVLMLIFTIMVGLPHPNVATQWTAVAVVVSFVFIFGYSWIGPVWLYGAEVRYSLTWITIESRTNNTNADISSSLPSCGRCCRCLRRLALLVHYRLCRWHCDSESGRLDLDMAAGLLCPCSCLHLVCMPRGESKFAGCNSVHFDLLLTYTEFRPPANL
jgi:hypothetical protein